MRRHYRGIVCQTPPLISSWSKHTNLIGQAITILHLCGIFSVGTPSTWSMQIVYLVIQNTHVIVKAAVQNDYDTTVVRKNLTSTREK